jgi:uncharacterized protein YcfJ
MNLGTKACLLLAVTSLALLGACNDEQEIAQAGGSATREVCTEQTVTRQKPVKDEDRVIGTVTGAVVGAVVGHEIGGKGTSQDIATIGGAAAGGYAGNRVQKQIQDNATEESTELVCRQVAD